MDKGAHRRHDMSDKNQDTITIRNIRYMAKDGTGNCFGRDGTHCAGLANEELCDRAPCTAAEREDRRFVIFVRAPKREESTDD